uniref:Uncharacterized protein n=1 Tax=Oryza brachyantha TaxID=4533 RepID=J3L0Q7_ORYBR
MPGSSPQPARRTFDGNVMCRATRLAESTLFASLGKGEWSMASKVMLSLSFRLLRIFVSQYRLVPCNPVDRSAPGPGAGARGRPIPGNTMLVECSQAILASALQARPLCGARLQEVRSVAQRALALVEAEGDIPAAVDVNLVLAFLATRDGQFDEALRRYKAAAQKDPADSRPYELADWLCCLVGLAKEQNAWRRSKKKLGGGTNPHDWLPVLRDQLLVAAALGHGGLTASDAHRAHISPAAWREVDGWLAAAALHLGLNRLTIRMLRAALRRLIQQWQP